MYEKKIIYCPHRSGNTAVIVHMEYFVIAFQTSNFQGLLVQKYKLIYWVFFLGKDLCSGNGNRSSSTIGFLRKGEYKTIKMKERELNKMYFGINVIYTYLNLFYLQMYLVYCRRLIPSVTKSLFQLTPLWRIKFDCNFYMILGNKKTRGPWTTSIT